MEKNSIQNFYEKVYEGTETPDMVADLQHVHLSQEFNFYVRNQILTKIYADGAGKRLLDIGASYGMLSAFFMNRGYHVHALEWDTSAVNTLDKLGVNVTQADVEKIPYPWQDNFFDEVFWGDNIEHLFFPELVGREIYRILKPGGRLVLSTPNQGWIVNRLYYLVKGMPRRTEGHKLPIWEWQHIRFFNKSEIRRFLDHCGLKHQFVFRGGEQRQPFAFLSKYMPSLFGSVMVVEVCK